MRVNGPGHPQVRGRYARGKQSLRSACSRHTGTYHGAKSYRDMQTELQIFPRAHVEPTLPNEHIAAIH
jgi:hypothetical protein